MKLFFEKKNLIKLFFRIYRKLLFIYSKTFKKPFDSERIENSYFNFIKTFIKNGSYIIEDHKINFKLNSDVTKRLILDEDFESYEIQKCLESINKDSIVIDIGANIGLHTVYFAQRAQDGIIFAFEPSMETFTTLVNNTNGLYNVLNLNFAVADETGISDFYVSVDDAYSSLKDTKRKKIQRVEKVLTYNLDSFLIPLNINKVDLVKIDVEGFEHEVLKGMLTIINRFRPVLFVEIYEGVNSNTNALETITLLTKNNYDAFVFKNNRLVEFNVHDDEYHNYFFYPK